MNDKKMPSTTGEVKGKNKRGMAGNQLSLVDCTLKSNECQIFGVADSLRLAAILARGSGDD